MKNVFIMTCNVSLEYEKSDQQSVVNYKDAQGRASMVEAERSFVDARVKQIIALKKQVCTSNQGFLVVNQKGIDPLSLDMLAKEGIVGLRRAKRRNMERLVLAAGGTQLNALDDLKPDVLGHAEEVYEFSLGEERFTFVEGVSNPQSVTLLLKGSSEAAITRMKDAIRDGLRAVKNAMEDGCLVAGAGAFEIAAHKAIYDALPQHPRLKLGLQAFAEALLVIPKTLASNSGFDPQESTLALQEEYRNGHVVGISVATGKPIDPIENGIWDNYRVKKQIIHSSAVLGSQLLLVDEIIKAGKSQAKAHD
jgi:T-complex protein 1 subunit zeta